MHRVYLSLIALLLSLNAVAQTSAEGRKERMVTCEPSMIINAGGGPTRLDNMWKGEFTLDVAFGVQWRSGHAAYIGTAMQQVQRRETYSDRRTSRTNLPLYAQYQWRAFGWHKDMADRYKWSPFVGLKAGWNFLQDIHTDEQAENENVEDKKNQEFVCPQLGVDFRCAEYMSIGVVLECEFSRRYIVDGGAFYKPRAAIFFKF